MRLLDSIPFIKYYKSGRRLLNDRFFSEGRREGDSELLKRPKRTEVINYLLSFKDGNGRYLEIGMRDPEANFNKIIAREKYSVDPGIENEQNPADFKMTSDEFFELLSAEKILWPGIRFDVIFIDGLHTATQADKDIFNSFRFLDDDGFIVLHDCNPPTEWHARENYYYFLSPAGGHWNGTTWRAFLKWRKNPSVYSCCIDSDWGIGVLSKSRRIGKYLENTGQFYEFEEFRKNKKEYLNLIDFEDFKKRLNG